MSAKIDFWNLLDHVTEQDAAILEYAQVLLAERASADRPPGQPLETPDPRDGQPGGVHGKAPLVQ